MRISDWSSDVCSSDLSSGNWTVLPSGVCRCQAGANSGEACETGIRKARKNPKSTNPARVNLITIPVWQCRPQPAECHQNRKLNQAPAERGADSGHRRTEESRVGKEWVRTCRSRG